MTDEKGGLAKRVIAGTYSFLADRLYDPLVVKGGFRIFGGDLNELVFEQGRQAVAAADGRPILDLPVGTAYFTTRMANAHDGIVVGVDIAEGMVRAAKKAAAEHDATNLLPVCGDAHRLPFDDDTFGAVVCSNGLQVMPGLTPSIRELVRVLAPGGTIFVSVVLAPVGGLVPWRYRRHLPTLLRPGRDVVGELGRAGITPVEFRHERLATLAWGQKPARGRSAD